jgi:hypothetical protein
MQGIPFRVDGKGRVLVAWMSRDKGYWALSNEGAEKFGPPIGTPDHGKETESFPIALIDGKGEVLLVWTCDKRVQWALYTPDGKYTGKRGNAEQSRRRNKPTAFVGLDENFYVVF